MGSRNIKSVITQISMDHNAKMARALRNVVKNISTDLAATGVNPTVSPMEHRENGLGIRVAHKVEAVKETTSSRKIAEAHRSLAQKLSSKSEMTKMMGL